MQERRKIQRDVNISFRGPVGRTGNNIKFTTAAAYDQLPAVGVDGVIYVTPDKAYYYDKAHGGGWHELPLASKVWVTAEANRVHGGVLPLANDTYWGALSVPPNPSTHTNLKTGDTYYDTHEDRLKIYSDSHHWKNATGVIEGVRTTENIVLANNQTEIPLTNHYDQGNVDVHMNGRLLTPGVSYTTVAAGDKITLTEPAHGGEQLVVTSYGVFSSFNANATRTLIKNTITVGASGDNEFNQHYRVGNIVIFHNGKALREDQYTATDGLKIVINSPTLTAGDKLEVVEFHAFLVADTYTKAEVQSLIGRASEEWEAADVTQARTVVQKQDTDGTKGKLHTGELGYDDNSAGDDEGAVWVGTGHNQARENIRLAKTHDNKPHIVADYIQIEDTPNAQSTKVGAKSVVAENKYKIESDANDDLIIDNLVPGKAIKIGKLTFGGNNIENEDYKIFVDNGNLTVANKKGTKYTVGNLVVDTNLLETTELKISPDEVEFKNTADEVLKIASNTKLKLKIGGNLASEIMTLATGLTTQTLPVGTSAFQATENYHPVSRGYLRDHILDKRVRTDKTNDELIALAYRPTQPQHPLSLQYLEENYDDQAELQRRISAAAKGIRYIVQDQAAMNALTGMVHHEQCLIKDERVVYRYDDGTTSPTTGTAGWILFYNMGGIVNDTFTSDSTTQGASAKRVKLLYDDMNVHKANNIIGSY